MDPNDALERVRVLKAAVLHQAALNVTREKWLVKDLPELLEASNELALAFEDLDNWMSTGGFLPIDWTRYRNGS
jgi:hypothetical protein